MHGVSRGKREVFQLALHLGDHAPGDWRLGVLDLADGYHPVGPGEHQVDLKTFKLVLFYCAMSPRLFRPTWTRSSAWSFEYGWVWRGECEASLDCGSERKKRCRRKIFLRYFVGALGQYKSDNARGEGQFLKNCHFPDFAAVSQFKGRVTEGYPSLPG
jgi:hypothetical protein